MGHGMHIEDTNTLVDEITHDGYELYGNDLLTTRPVYNAIIIEDYFRDGDLSTWLQDLRKDLKAGGLL